jgi:hypothetical protein
MRRTDNPSGTAVLAMILAVPFLALLNGWVVKTGWNWFIPQITGWPRLGILQAIGLVLVVGFILPSRYRPAEERDRDGAEVFADLAADIASTLFALGLGWVVHQVMA